jgi:hypothetical protein
MTTARHVGWALFFGVFFSAIGLYILRIAGGRSPEDGRFSTFVVGLIPLLVGGRFFFAAFTGRIPAWMEELIDDPDG